MKPVLFAFTMLTASPALAHVGTHSHPHANDASSLPLLFGLFAIAAATTVAMARRR